MPHRFLTRSRIRFDRTSAGTPAHTARPPAPDEYQPLRRPVGESSSSNHASESFKSGRAKRALRRVRTNSMSFRGPLSDSRPVPE
jgi:hypothetical protein